MSTSHTDATTNHDELDYALLRSQLQKLISHFDLNQPSGGCGVTVFHHGQPVVAPAHGRAFKRRPSPQNEQDATVALPSLACDECWQPKTLSLNFSTGKGILATLIHVLVSQRLLDYDTPIAHYWADFAKGGKSNITLRAVMRHQAGLYNIRDLIDHAKDMLDWQSMLAKVAAMPLAEPRHIGNNLLDDLPPPAYSALISGWILGGLVESVTHLDLQQALEHYLLKPLGLVGQVYLGVPPTKVGEVATQMREKQGQSKPTLVADTPSTLDFYQSLAQMPTFHCWQTQLVNNGKPLTTQAINGLYFDPSQANFDIYQAALVPHGSREFNYYHPVSLQAKIPAANAVASAYALATIYAMLAAKGVWQGNTVITSEIFGELSGVHNTAFDKVMPAAMHWRLGYHRVFSRCHPSPHAFGHMGYNGSVAWCDPSRELAVAFVHNYDVTMLNDVRQFIINESVLAFFR